MPLLSPLKSVLKVEFYLDLLVEIEGIPSGNNHQSTFKNFCSYGRYASLLTFKKTQWIFVPNDFLMLQRKVFLFSALYQFSAEEARL